MREAAGGEREMKRWLVIVVAVLALQMAGIGSSWAQEATASQAGRSTPAASVNVNSATAEQFEALPGIGAKMAARIVEYRQKNGPFKKVEELMNVKGIGEQSFLKLKPYLTLGTPKADKAQGDQR